MKTVTALFALLALAAPVRAKPPAKADKQATPTPAAQAPKQPKVKVYTFGGLDVEGKLKTPQLLYFLNRIKAEFDTSAPGKRTFMKELERSADDTSL
jgi:hypothetical protein